MSRGMFTAPERVIRNGRLVCFKGEVMTYFEAEQRGLIAAEKPVAEKQAPKAEEVAEPEACEEVPEEAAEDIQEEDVEAEEECEVDPVETLVSNHSSNELKALAEELGVDFPKGASKPVIAQAIVDSGALEVN